MKFNEFPEVTSLTDDGILLLQEASTLAIKKVKLSTVKQYIGVTSGSNTSNIKDEILKDNPLNYWQFDELTGRTAVDLGSAKKDGTYTSVVLGQTSLANGSLYSAKFTNQNSVFSFTNTLLNSNTDITIELIVYIPSLNISGFFLRIGTDYQLGLGVSGGGDISSPGNYLIGIAGNVAWRPTYKSIGLGTHHLVMNYKGLSSREWLFYIDGFLVNTLGAATIQTPNNVGIIGGVSNSELTVDEVAIYNKSLSPNRILNHANTVIY